MTSALLQNYARFDLSFEHGDGLYLFDTNGRRYLDFAAGIAVDALGHAHPHLVEALTQQAEKLWHVSNLFHIPEQERLAERLVKASFADVAFFANSGAEAIECALKMARRYHWNRGRPERNRIITFEGAFHGRTIATISAAAQQKYLEGFEPALDGFDKVPLHDESALRSAITDQTAGILIEPVQGESGIHPIEPGFLRKLRSLADDHGILLIFDEVQCGMGRTGKLFACEHAGVDPDIMALAKGIGGGFPLAACLARADAASGIAVGTHGSTFGGNPLAMAVGNAVLDVILEDGFLENVTDTANYLHQQLAGLADRNPGVIEEVRGTGLMIGLKCRITNSDLIRAAQEKGLLSVGAGDNVVRLLPPLIVTKDHIRDAIDILDSACAAVAPESGT